LLFTCNLCRYAAVAMANGGVGVGIAGAERTYRLEVHVGRLEFCCHPLMGKEDYLAAQLEEMFRGYKRREASGLVALYTAKSAAAGARANALKQEMAAGAALWLEGVAPRERLTALEDEAEEARRLALDETERARGAVRHMVGLALSTHVILQSKHHSMKASM
jgi:coiled-coil and C2 domain-containing protein 2A